MRNILKPVVILAIFSFSTVLFAADWPGFRGPNGDGVVPDAKVPNKLALTPVWKITLGDGIGQFAVEGDKAVIYAERGDDESAVCLDAKTGKEIWATRIDKTKKDGNGNGPKSTPAISDGRVYLYSSHLKLACLDLASGKEIWNHNVAGEYGSREITYGSASSPVIAGDLVVVIDGGNKGIVAYNKNSGTLAWAVSNDKYTHATPVVATILGTRQVIALMQNGLVSVDAKTGDILWTFEHPKALASGASPVVGGKNGDIVYCSRGYGVGGAACRVSKNGQTWAAKALWPPETQTMNHWSTPVYHDGCLYSLVGQNKPIPETKGALTCLDIETGEIKWSQKDIGSQGGLIVVGDKLLVQGPTGDLILVAASPAGYKELGRSPLLKGKNWNAPAYVNGLVFVRTNSSKETPAEAACVKINDAN